MVTLFILAQVAVLGGVIFYSSQFPLTFRMLLGLIITWPTLGLYVYLELPAGMPDLEFQRLYVGAMLLVAFILMVAHREKMRAAGHAIVTEQEYNAASVLFPRCVLTYVALMTFSTVIGIVRGVGGVSSITDLIEGLFLPVVLYAFTKSSLTSRSRLTWLLGAIVLGALMVEFSGVYERLLDLQASAFPIASFDEAGMTRYLDVPGGRASGVIGSPPVFGSIMGGSLLIVLSFLVHAKRIASKLVFAFLAMVLAYGVLVSFTRSAWLSVAIALAFSQFFLRGLWKVTLPIGLIGIGILLVFLPMLMESEVVQERALESKNVSGRVERAIWSWNRFLEAPILGRGPGALDQLMSKQFAVDGFATSHNTYLTIMVDNGVFAFGCFVLIMLRWMSHAWFAIRNFERDKVERSVATALLGAVLIWLLTAASTELRYFSYYNALFWIAGAAIERLAAAASPDVNSASLSFSPQLSMQSPRSI